ncbi:MAG: 5-(carboxyamino)imidazole ribonucleotide mutase [Candidatus Abyssobacteria bacterium SURF_17]|jgi:phosphoribosylaminoimidazole carboxylase PurE protein|uniref:N5-carboxyaminoimidazole ribonucleotide mutase n=1 Tax=Candidatus Abyssobacteria bacterium SURF_17 TaxID=2093361 RepID=A0A419F3B2_9BACT|nr:MAG: 5-(carboxyamino)imidazole ribonucleotide mutase [Candidatus Abyssubacteria bacterium SURF_17]
MPDRKTSKKPVLIFMGSENDHEVMREAVLILEQFAVPCEMRVSSAHRSPKRTIALAEKAARQGTKIIIAGAGAAAHLAGVIAAHTTLPVIGVPLDSSPLKGLDALLSTLQMPAGVPVATMAVGKAGARNAAILAIEILALHDARLRAKLARYKKKLAQSVEQKERLLRKSANKSD